MFVLAFVYIKKYRIFENESFNCSSEFIIEYDYKRKKLHIKRNEKQMVNLYGDNIVELTALIGDNGAGKSTLLDYIINEYLFYGGKESIGSLQVIWDTMDESFIVIGDRSISVDSEDRIKYRCLSKMKFFELSKIKLLYLHPTLSNNDYRRKQNDHFFNYSLAGMIVKHYRSKLNKNMIERTESNLRMYFLDEVYRQVQFAQQHGNNEVIKDIIKIPNILTIWISDFHEYSESIESMIDSNPKHKEFLQSLYKASKFEYKDEKEYWLTVVAFRVFLNALTMIISEPTVPQNQKEVGDLRNLVFESVAGDKPKSNIIFNLHMIYDVITKIEEKISDNSKVLLICEHGSFIRWLVVEQDKIYQDIISCTDNSVQVNIKEAKVVGEFIKRYKDVCNPYYPLDFEWVMSSGEDFLLSLFTRINLGLESISKYNQRDYSSNIVILLDEIDALLHPRWQSCLIEKLHRFLNAVYKDYSFQVFISSHSPIILSDVPKSNTIYLREGKNFSKEVEIETFGQNIYSLYRDSFLFDQTESTFSLKKYNKILNELKMLVDEKRNYDSSPNSEQNVKTTIRKAKLLVANMGEPLKIKALNQYIRKVDKKYKSDELKQVIEEYKKLTSDDKDDLIKYIIESSTYD